MSDLGKVLEIPQPKTYGFLGNLPLIDRDSPTLSFCKLAQEYGPIFRFSLFHRSIVIVSAPDLVADVCDESRFDKAIGHLMKVRDFAGDGLFTSRTANPLWKKAHNILLPSFSLQAMKGYHAMMVDIALQLVQKWERLNPNEWIDVPDDMTRLTLDTIGLCGFSYRFNSYYRETPNPFIVSMVRALDEAMHYGNRLPLQNSVMWSTKRRYQRDIQTMYSLVDRLIAERKSNGDQGETDLLARMLNAKDPETGERLDDENIRFQIITFLIAGHETTSGLLSFALYFLLKHPDVFQKAREEADAVLGGSIPTYEQVLKLSYVRMVLNEALRLWPTAPQFSLFAKQDTMIAGRYPIKQREAVSVLLPQLHRDRGAWGEDAELFRPERFADPGSIPTEAYKPFGNGQRACIGMQFALHEATLVLGMILQHFDLVDDGGYELKVRQTLTLKPEGFKLRVRSRKKSLGYAAWAGAVNAVGSVGAAGKAEAKGPADKSSSLSGVNGRPLLVLYGSNMGTAEGIARELADLAGSYGIPAKVQPLDERMGDLPKEGAVLIVTSSYNGRPPANARKFAEWVGQAAPGELEGVRYAVFGCGDRNWASTYQDVPRWIDEQLARGGAARFAARGEADASGDFEQQYEQWRRRMWTEALQTFGLMWQEESEEERGKLRIEFVGAGGDSAGPLARAYQAVRAMVRVNRELQATGSGRSTRHLELELPAGLTYREGDHVGVIPVNRAELVERVLRRFRLEGGEQAVLSSDGFGAAHLPLDRPVCVDELLKQSVELQEPASRVQIRSMAACTVCPPHKRELEALLEDEVYRERVLKPRVTMLELLERYEACELPFARFLELLQPLSPRYYSISSSPAVSPAAVSLTVGVVCGPAWSGAGEFHGTASNYLAECREGEGVAVFVRTPESGFKPPEDPATPVIMVGPGTGVAPFRGFLQARAALKQEGASLGVAHLFFGCRNEADFLYRDELEQYASDGVVKLHVAFSRKEGQPKTYVQHLMEQRGEELIRLLDQGGRLYVCGDASKMAPDVEETLCRAYQAVHRVGEPESRSWLDQLQEARRYAKDVWSGA